MTALLVICGLALGAPAAGMAQNVNPTDEEYDQGVLGIANSGGPASTSAGAGGSDSAPSGQVATESVGELPFTGLDVAAIAAIGIGLAGGGFVIRRASRAGTGTG